MQEQIRKSLLSYIIVFLLVAQAGFPFFTGNIWLVINTVITGILFLVNGKSFYNKFFALYFLSFLLLMVFQVLILGKFLAGPFFGFLLRLTYAYMAIKLIGKEFPDIYVKLIYFFSIISLVLWILLAFVPGAYQISLSLTIKYIRPLELYPDQIRGNLIIYTNEYWLLNTIPRNAGPFWEPGGYGVFLVIAFLFNFMKSQKFIDKKNIVFIISIITTFSLGTYIAFLVFIISYLILVNKLKRKASVVFASALLVLFLMNYNKYDFLGSKLEARESKVSVTLDDNTTYENLDYQVGRNEQARLDLKSFFKNPIFGEGQFEEYEFGASASGLTVVLRKWGIVGFFLIFGTMYYSFKKYIQYNGLQKGYLLVAVSTFMAVSLTQALWGKPLFLGFSFVFLILTEYKYPVKYKMKNDNIISGV